MKKLLAVLLFLILGLVACSSEEAEPKKVEAKPKTEAPAPTPAPAPEPENKVTAEMKNYAEKMMDPLGNFNDALSGLSSTLDKSASDPTLMMTDEWKMDVAIYLTFMEEALDEIRGISPPSQMQDVHSLMLKSVAEYQFVVDNFPRAIDNLDADLIGECARHMKQGGEYMSEASALTESKIN